MNMRPLAKALLAFVSLCVLGLISPDDTRAFDYVRDDGTVVRDLADPASLYPDWLCEEDIDDDGSPFQHCGYGMAHHDCYQSGGVEECQDYISFDPFPEAFGDSFSNASLLLQASVDGTPLVGNATTSVPLGKSATLSWAVSSNPDHPYEAPDPWSDTEEDVLSHAVLNLDIYEWAVGSSTLISSTTLAYGDTPDIPVLFERPGHYILLYSATYPEHTYPPGMNVGCGVGGDLCPVPEFSLEGTRTLMTIGHTLYDNGFDDGFGIPADYGILEFDVGPSDAPQISNVLFIPGIEGSRLYDSDGNKLWEPISASDFLHGDDHVRALMLDSSGKSINDIDVGEGDVIDSVGANDYYGSFLDALDDWKSDGIIGDWKAAAYDWRLSLDDILSDDSALGMENQLRSLASSSPNGKVTIIAHSNGGLVAKALLKKLGATAPQLVDNLILVAVPQSGAPEDIGALLYGYDQGISFLGFPLVHAAVVRAFAQNAPMAYHLLPSQAYFDSSPTHPVGLFTGAHAYAKDRTDYGGQIDSWPELAGFLDAVNGDRAELDPNDLTEAAIANQSLVQYGKSVHDALDAWLPPAGISVYQIAGWGDDTIDGVEFYEQVDTHDLRGYVPMYRPLWTKDGDGTVPASSALLMDESDNIEKYWVNLGQYNDSPDANKIYKHGNILGIELIQSFIRDIINHDVNDLPKYFSSASPTPSLSKELRFYLHSPLSLDLYDDRGRHTGIDEKGSLEESIPGSEYGEFGEVKYISVPSGERYHLLMAGEDSGTFSLDIQEVSGNTATTTTIANVPVSANTRASIEVSDTGSVSSLEIDEDDDGVVDVEIAPQEGKTTAYHATAPRPFLRGFLQSLFKKPFIHGRISFLFKQLIKSRAHFLEFSRHSFDTRPNILKPKHPNFHRRSSYN